MLKPVGARLVIRYICNDDRLIIVPAAKKWEPVLAEVLAVGDGARLETGALVPVIARPGDRVLVPAETGYRWTAEDGGDCFIINERDVIAVVTGE